MNSDRSATRSGLVGRYLTVLDLKTSCRALSASVQWTKTICRGWRVPQPMNNCHESHVNKRLFQYGGGRSCNAVSRDKKSASVRQADVPTNFTGFDPDKKSAVSTTKNRLVCSSLYVLLLLPKRLRLTLGRLEEPVCRILCKVLNL